MSLLLITYDLKVPGRDYKVLYDAIKSAPGWWHYLESTWIISTTESLQVWVDRLNGLIDKNDRILVVNITGAERNGWLQQDAWQWLNNHDR